MDTLKDRSPKEELTELKNMVIRSDEVSTVASDLLRNENFSGFSAEQLRTIIYMSSSTRQSAISQIRYVYHKLYEELRECKSLVKDYLFSNELQDGV